MGQGRSRPFPDQWRAASQDQDRGAFGQHGMEGQTRNRHTVTGPGDHCSADRVAGQPSRIAEGRQPIQGRGEDRLQTRENPDVRPGPVGGVTGEEAQEAQVPTIVGEHGHGHAVVEPGGKQVLPPGARLGKWNAER